MKIPRPCVQLLKTPTIIINMKPAMTNTDRYPMIKPAIAIPRPPRRTDGSAIRFNAK